MGLTKNASAYAGTAILHCLDDVICGSNLHTCATHELYHATGTSLQNLNMIEYPDIFLHSQLF